MIIHNQNHGLWLAELKDFDHIPRHPHIVENNVALTRIVKWADNFLTNPHPQLGREGSVCPYTRPSMEKELFWLTVRRTERQELLEVENSIMRYRDWFLALEPTAGPDTQYKTILVLFPDVTDAAAPELIDALQERLKAKFVAEGLMIGQFHAHCEQPGLWNEEFRPLQTPVPLLAMRNMVPSDFPFLAGKKEYMKSYLELFHDRIPGRIRNDVNHVALKYGLTAQDQLKEAEYA